jgi:hypothetical protein
MSILLTHNHNIELYGMMQNASKIVMKGTYRIFVASSIFQSLKSERGPYGYITCTGIEGIWLRREARNMTPMR